MRWRLRRIVNAEGDRRLVWAQIGYIRNKQFEQIGRRGMLLDQAQRANCSTAKR